MADITGINFDDVNDFYTSNKQIAVEYINVANDWKNRFPYIEPVSGDVLTGKLSDCIKDSKFLRTYVFDSMSVKFSVRLTNDLRLSSNDLFIFAGNRSYYRTMYYIHAHVLCFCMYQANMSFPGHKWIMGDAGGNHFSHVYHNSYHVCDLNYPTFKESNTHYYREGLDIEKIWKEKQYPYRTLIPNTVDIPKLYYFLNLIKKCFPYSSIMVNRGMHNILTSFGGNAVTNYGEDRQEWNHDKHIHCYLGSQINFDAVIG